MGLEWFSGNAYKPVTGWKTGERKIMKKIIYKNQNEVENFDLKRFLKSISQYAKVSEKEVKEALAEFDQYETMHVSCLVEVGMKLIGAKSGEAAMKEYFTEHAGWFEEGKFERLRRITGYLVGTLERCQKSRRKGSRQTLRKLGDWWRRKVSGAWDSSHGTQHRLRTVILDIFALSRWY